MPGEGLLLDPPVAVVAMIAIAALLAFVAVVTGWERIAIWTSLGSLVLYPLLLSEDSAVYHVGIAGPIVEVRTFTLALLPFAFGVFSRGLLPKSFMLLAIWLAFSATFFWRMDAMAWAGATQIGVGVLGWMAGAHLARSQVGNARLQRTLVACVAAIILIEVTVSVLQFAGVPINPLPFHDAALLGNRANGTLNHPDNLGKALLLLMALVLPATTSKQAGTRRLALASFLVAFLPLALSQGRANFVGALMMVVAWALLLPRGHSLALKFAILGGSSLVVLASAGLFLARFDEDPTGGARGDLLAIALRHLPDYVLVGVGPNSYTTVTGPLDGSWIPVHSTFLLVLLELGAIGALLLFLPVVTSSVYAWSNRRAEGDSGAASRALISTVPAIVVIGATGWGLAGSSILALWFLTWSYLNTLARSRALETTSPSSESEGSLAPVRSARPPTAKHDRHRAKDDHDVAYD